MCVWLCQWFGWHSPYWLLTKYHTNVCRHCRTIY